MIDPGHIVGKGDVNADEAFPEDCLINLSSSHLDGGNPNRLARRQLFRSPPVVQPHRHHKPLHPPAKPVLEREHWLIEAVEKPLEEDMGAANHDDHSDAVGDSRMEQIEQLQRQVDALLKERNGLQRRVTDLRDQNMGLAKKLACKCARSCSTRSQNGESDPELSVEEMQANMVALDLMVLSRDEEIEELTNRQKTSNELIAIMRDQLFEMQKEKSKLANEYSQCKEKAERKNAALKESLQQCDATIDRMKSQVQEVQLSADKALKAAEREKKIAEKKLKKELSDERARANETITELQRQLQHASKNSSLSKEESICSDKDDSAGQRDTQLKDDLREERQRGQDMILELEQKLCAASQALLRLQEENDLLKGSTRLLEGKKQTNGSEEFSIYQPIVKNLSFLLEMKDRALREMKFECDEAWKEVEKKTAIIEQLTQQLPEEDPGHFAAGAVAVTACPVGRCVPPARQNSVES